MNFTCIFTCGVRDRGILSKVPSLKKPTPTPWIVIMLHRAATQSRLFHVSLHSQKSSERTTAGLPVLIVLFAFSVFNVVQAEDSRPVVFLEAPSEANSAEHRQLIREVVRQAFLMTAREDFHAMTRDGLLREDCASETPNLRSFRMTSAISGDYLAKVQLEDAQKDNETAPWASSYEGSTETRLQNALVNANAWSQHEFVDWLKQAKLPITPVTGEKPTLDLKAPFPMEFVAQVTMLRQLHAGLLHDPTSPEILARIAELYGLLGSVTEIHWGAEHKVFKARALLYAERAVRHGPKNPAAAWAKAFVQALCGLDHWAVEELKRAKSLSTEETTPKWADALTAFVTWNENGLAKCVEEEQPLAAYFMMRAMEMTGSEDQRIQAVKDVMQTSPDCLRAAAVLANEEALGLRRSVGQSQLSRFIGVFPMDLQKIPGLPSPLADVLKAKQRFTSAIEVFDRTAEMVKLLKEAPPQADAGEPSLPCLAMLAENLHFVHAIQSLKTENWHLAMDMSESREAFQHLLVNHSAKEFLGVFQSDTLKGQAAYRQATPALLKLPVSNASWPLIEWFRWFRMKDQNQLEWRIRDSRDDVTPDLLVKLQDDLPLPVIQQTLAALRKVSPDCPGVIIATIRYDEKTTAANAVTWEQTSTNPLVLMALGDRYERTAAANLESRAAAERCWLKLVELSPSYASYRPLRQHYWIHGMEEEWKQATLDSLNSPSFGLDEPHTHAELAEWYMNRQEWAEARPHALRAAEAYSAYGLATGARCMEGLGEWDKAEAFVRANSERYDNAWHHWYMWCQRTGRGDLDAAADFAAKTIASMNPSQKDWEIAQAVYSQLEGDQQEALRILQNLVRKEDSLKRESMRVMLLLHELERHEERDQVLKKLTNRLEPSFTSLLCEQLIRPADGTAPPFSSAELEFLFGYDLTDGNPTNAAYLIAKLLQQKNRDEEAVAWLQRSASSPVTNKLNCVLASVELRQSMAEVPPTRIHELDATLAPAEKLVVAGLEHHRSGRRQNASQLLDQAVAAAPQWPVAKFWSAKVSADAGQPQKAIEAYTAVLELVPNQPYVLCCRAQVKASLKDFQGATEDYEAALAASPDFRLPHDRLGWIKASAPDASFRNAEQALLHANRATSSPNAPDGDSLVLLAAAHAEAGEFPQAVKLIESAISKKTYRNQKQLNDWLELYRNNKPYHQGE